MSAPETSFPASYLALCVAAAALGAEEVGIGLEDDATGTKRLGGGDGAA